MQDNEISQLKLQLAKLKADTSRQFDLLEQRIAKLESPNVSQTNSIQSEQTQIKSVVTPVPIVPTGESEKPLPVPTNQWTNPKSVTQPTEPKESIFILALQWLLSFHPISVLLAPAINLYTHFSRKGQTPLFLFVVIGITLLVAGFGYLVQLMVGELGAASKTLLLLVVAAATSIAGVKLSSTKNFQELASSIIGLGIVLGFVTVYMAGSYYHLMAPWLVLISYFAIVLCGSYLANRHNTRIVSVITLAGASLAPLLITLDPISSLIYLCGLALLCATSLYQAHRESWPWFAYLALTLCFFSIDSSLVVGSVYLLHGITIEVFYLLFLTYAVMQVNQGKFISANHLTLLGAATLAAAGLLYDLPTTTPILSIISGLNVLLLSGIYLKNRKALFAVLAIAVASVWAIFAILVSLQSDYWHIAFGLEGLFLLFFALRQGFNAIRIEAQGLLLVAIAIASVSVTPYFPLPALHTLQGWVICLSIGLLLFCWRMLIADAKTSFKWEQKLPLILFEWESLWFTVLSIASAWIVLGIWMSPVIFLIQGILLYRARSKDAQFSELVSLGCAAVFIFVWHLGVQEVNSYRFSELPFFAQLSFALGFAQLWLFAAFYRKFYPTGMLAELAERLRLAFYVLLPVVALPSIARRYPDLLTLALWGSTFVAFGLGRLVRHPLLRIESFILACIATLATLASMMFANQSDLPLHQIAFVLGVGFCGWFLLLETRRKMPIVEQRLASLTIYFLAFGMTISLKDLFSLDFALLVLSSYIFGLLLLQRTLPSVKRNSDWLRFSLIGLLFSSWIIAQINVNTFSILFLVATLLYCVPIFVSLPFTNVNSRLNQLRIDQSNVLIIFNLLFAVSYFALLVGIDWALLMTPAFIVHGSALLFIHKQKMLAKLAIALMFIGLVKLGLVDSANAVLWQKVVLLLGIGIFMLFTAFVFQKRFASQQDQTGNPLI